MRTLQNLLIGIVRSALWPMYLALAARATRQAPWPREVGQPISAILAWLAAAVLATNVVRRLFGAGGWAEDVLAMPPAVARQVRQALTALATAGVVFLIPVFLLTQGLIAPAGRPASAPAVVRGLILGFQIAVLLIAWRVLRRRSALVGWLTEPPVRFERLARHRRELSAAAVAGIAAVIGLDARGYCFSARRLASGAAGSLAIAVVCWGIYRVVLRVIDNHAWRWIKAGHVLSRRGEPDASCMPDDLAGRLRHLAAFFAAALSVAPLAWVWDLDLALFRFIAEQALWPVDVAKGVYVTVGDLSKALVVVALCAAAWRYMSTVFALVVFPRIPDDPGIRFAVVTLCRYAVVGVGLLGALSAVHLGLEKIGVVLAALGVGLGFGLQEIVSNFVCGIILLLERPIRVGDIVTVGGQTGKVDRINIRATTIINGDNQSMIMPNRAFITGELVNWTLKDKIIRVSVRIKVALGNDPDRVSELLLSIARDDPDVLSNPAPGALMDEISESALVFTLSAYVPEPSLGGRVKHRLFREIQHRFQEAEIRIPAPIQELIVTPLDAATAGRSFAGSRLRVDPPSPTPPGLWPTPPRPAPEPVEDSHRGVDE